MASKTETIDSFMVVDSVGDFGVGRTLEAAKEDYENNIQPMSDCEGFRVITLTVNVALPEAVELTGTAPDSGAAALTVS